MLIVPTLTRALAFAQDPGPIRITLEEDSPTVSGLLERLFGDSPLAMLGPWVAVLVIAWLSNFITKRVIVRGVRIVVDKTKATWDDVFVEHHVFERLSHLAPALVVYVAAPVLLEGTQNEIYPDYLRRLANVWMIIAGARAFGAFLDALVTLGRRSESTRDKPLRSYAQVVQLVVWMAAGILSVAVLMQKSPWALLTGLGAMTAILLLVFKDSILGFVASVRIASNDMLRAGDWVEMPKYGADGDVLDIGLHTVKIQNWDKTITTIPTHAFMTDSFKNWRGMTQSGGRRIKRSLSFDMHSVRFLEEEDLTRLGKIEALRDYLAERTREVAQWNKSRKVDDASPVNGRRLTNLGTFRAYLESYLRDLEPIRKDMTFLVRQLPPSDTGIPIEIYCFSGEQRWVEYEAIIGDIIDHLLAILGEFNLRLFQQPSGADLRVLAGTGEQSIITP